MMKIDESGVLHAAAPGAYLTSDVLLNAVSDGYSGDLLEPVTHLRVGCFSQPDGHRTRDDRRSVYT